MITHTYEIDIVPGKMPPVVRLSQGDTDFVLYFEIMASTGELEIEVDTTASLRGKMSDGTTYEAVADLNGTMLTVEGDEDLTAVAGKGLFEFCLTHDGKYLSTQNFPIIIEENPKEEEAG